MTAYIQCLLACSFLDQLQQSADWSFVKTSVKQSMKHKVCSNFQMSFLHLSQTPLVDEALGQVDIFVRSLGQLTFGQSYLPSRGI